MKVIKRKFDFNRIKKIYLIITSKCNLKCKFCIRESDGAYFEEIRYEKLVEIIKQLKESCPSAHLMISGGEPTQHADIFEILTLSKKYFNKLSLISNGTQPHKIYELAKCFPSLRFQISIDGPEFIHNSLRGGNSYSNAFRTAELLLESGSDLTISTTVSMDNINYIDALFEDLKKIKKRIRWKVSKEIACGSASNRINSHIPVDRWNKLVLKLSTITKHWDGELLAKSHFNFIGKKLDFHGVNKDDLLSLGCQAGLSQLYIYPDLAVVGCPLLKALPFAKLDNSEFNEVAKSKNLQRILTLSFNSESKCSSCEYLSLCKGGCIGKAQLNNKSLEYGDPECPIPFGF